MRIGSLFILLLALAAGCGSGKGKGDGGGSPGTDGDAACPFQGTWTAVQYSCAGGAPQDLSSSSSFQLAISGPTGLFTEVIAGGAISCGSAHSGAVSCAGDTTSFSDGPTACDPANCVLPDGCQTTSGGMSWTFTQPTAATLMTVSIDPTPIPICLNTGMSNPVTFYWQKQ